MIRITAKRDGFRRCGIAHSKQPTEYADDRFTEAELEVLFNEPMLEVEAGVEGGKAKGGKKASGARKE
jgi:hypothetical protein